MMSPPFEESPFPIPNAPPATPTPDARFTGVGSTWHHDAADAAAWVSERFQDFPFRPQIPAAGRDMIAEAMEASPAADLPAEFAALSTGFIKDQVAGPMTLAAAGKGDFSALAQRVQTHAVERARRILKAGKIPVIAFDEPSWTSPVPDPGAVRSMLAMTRAAGAIVGFHSCGNAPWGEVLEFVPDFINPDVSGGAAPLVAAHKEALKRLIGGTGWIGWGLVPTLTPPAPARTIFKDFLKAIAPLGDAKTVLRKSFFTPACGLASHTPAQAEDILRVLFELSRYARVDHLGLPSR